MTKSELIDATVKAFDALKGTIARRTRRGHARETDASRA